MIASVWVELRTNQLKKFLSSTISLLSVLQAFQLEQILHDRNMEISALKSQISSEMENIDGVNSNVGTPPPKIPSPIFSDIPIELFDTIHLLKEEVRQPIRTNHWLIVDQSQLTVLAKEQEDHITNFKQFYKQKSFSDSDINSCEEYLSGKRLGGDAGLGDSNVASLASSSDSHCLGR